MSTSPDFVYVVDDDASFLTATTRLLRASGFDVEAFDASGDFLARCEALQPGCVVADLQMPGLNGLELQAALARSRNPMPVVFLTGHGDIATTVRAMREGAEDFLEKRASKDDLLDAVRRALARGAQERSSRARRNDLWMRFASLSPREREVLAGVLKGRLNKQIAGDLGISERTVKLHRSGLMAKLNVRAVAELSRLAQDVGFDRETGLAAF